MLDFSRSRLSGWLGGFFLYIYYYISIVNTDPLPITKFKKKKDHHLLFFSFFITLHTHPPLLTLPSKTPHATNR